MPVIESHKIRKNYANGLKQTIVALDEFNKQDMLEKLAALNERT